MLSPDASHPNTQVNTSIDNSSVVRQLQAFLQGYPPRREYPHDADILSHIRWLWNQQPRFCHKVSWVKAHQDEKTSFHLLDLPAQLNICADALATEYLTQAILPSDVPISQPAFFPTANVCLLINSHRITAQYSASIRLAQRYHPSTHDRKTGNQLLITSFFPHSLLPSYQGTTANPLDQSQNAPDNPRRNNPSPGRTTSPTDEKSS